MTVSYCPVCGERTVHTAVRPADGIGVRHRCRQHTDVDEQLESGDYELAY